MRPQGQLDQLQLLTYLAFNCVSLELQSHACIQLIADDIMHCRQIYMCHPRAQPEHPVVALLLLSRWIVSCSFLEKSKRRRRDKELVEWVPVWCVPHFVDGHDRIHIASGLLLRSIRSLYWLQQWHPMRKQTLACTRCSPSPCPPSFDWDELRTIESVVCIYS